MNDGRRSLLAGDKNHRLQAGSYKIQKRLQAGSYNCQPVQKFLSASRAISQRRSETRFMYFSKSGRTALEQ